MALAVVLRPIKELVLAEASHIQGFMQLLMKPRNGIPWSAEDRAAIRLHLRHLAGVLPILVIFTLPGGSLLLPLLAWFLDRRKRSYLISLSLTGPVKKQPSVPTTEKAVESGSGGIDSICNSSTISHTPYSPP